MNLLDHTSLVARISFAALLVAAVGSAKAVPVLISTSDPTAWQVAVNVGGTDGSFSSFATTGFATASGVIGRGDYIANNSTGTNGGLGTWTFFNFQQTFDLTGYDASTADLEFRWAADDSGEGFAIRGTWTPKFSLNGGALIPYPGSPTATYNYSPLVILNSGFVAGLNTINFYVEGNGVSDGFELQTESFKASPSSVPDGMPPFATLLLLGIGLTSIAMYRRMTAAGTRAA